ncbi:10395_t:CDS:1, partial [Scutellospora calospora]
DTELFDSARKLKIASANTLDYKLFRSQRRIIVMNEALLSLYMHKFGLYNRNFRFIRLLIIN